MTEIRLDGEWFLKRIEAIEGELNAIRREAAMGAAPSSTVTGIDLDQIEWKLRGSEPADPDDPWAWAFAYDQDGAVLDETQALVKVLKRDGKALIDEYELTLSGKDKTLLSRKKLKNQGRGR